MGKTKKTVPKAGTFKVGKRATKAKIKAAAGNQAKVRHMRDRKGHLHLWDSRLPTGLVAKPTVAQPKSKHRSYFEFVENREKKKKLEFQVVTKKDPPPGYEFVPIGNPALTAACKELSREQEAMIFIVSAYTGGHIAPELGLALNRIGHHVRERIVKQARESLGEMEDLPKQAELDVPEPIPEDQEEINRQADAAIRDLFPRIPNTDRQTIIEHSFRKGAKGLDGMPLVGLAADLTLSRRVQLAVVAHIRHTHTRYDQLLRETTYPNARRAVENLCLDILVKWRGDEENGRDQLDEILREVVVISDSEDDYDEDDDEDDDDDEDAEDTDMTSGESSDDTAPSTGARPPPAEQVAPVPGSRPLAHVAPALARAPSVQELTEAERVKAAAKRAHRGFQRYQAVRDQAWQQALDRQRQVRDHTLSGSAPVPMNRPQSETVHAPLEREAYYQPLRPDHGGGSRPRDHHAHQRYTGNNMVYPSEAPRDAGLPDSYRHSPDHVTVPRSRPPAPYYNRGEGQGSGDGGASGYVPIVGSRTAFRSSPGLRTVVSRPAQEDLRDYLVPSIEPTSPLASQFSAQTLEDRRQDQRPGYWQSMLGSQPGAAAHRLAFSPVPDEGFIRVHRQAGDVRPAELVPNARRPPDAFGRENSDRVLFLSRPGSPRSIPGPDPTYRQEHPSTRNMYIPADVAHLGHEDARHTTAQLYPARSGVAPESRQRPAVLDDGSIARYRDASRPIIVEDERTWREPTRSYPAPLRPRNEAEPAMSRQPFPGERQETGGGRISGRADPWPRPSEVDRRPPLDFIPVSNMFPRPHRPPVMIDETDARASAFPTEARLGDRRPALAFGRDYVQRLPDRMLDPQANPPRQERVVRYEYVSHGHMGEEQAGPIYDHTDVYHRAPASLAAGNAQTATYHSPNGQRNPRQDGVIYIE